MNLLLTLRNILGISQTDVADSLGISLVSYNKKEKGHLQFSQSEMKKVAETFSKNGLKGIKPEDIFFKDEVTIKLTSNGSREVINQ